MRCLKIVALAGSLLAPAQLVLAQQSVNHASVGGQVSNPSGAVIAGAHVSIRHLDTNVAATGVTDADGRFRFPSLRIGPSKIVVRYPGFRDFTRRLTLTAGAAFDLRVTLDVPGVETNVTVTAEAAALDAARTQIASTISGRESGELPLNGRNFLDLALLVPGVAPANVSLTQLFPETSAVPGISLSVGSQRNLSNSFIVDGLSANDDAAALSGITYGVDAIEQFQVVTAGGQAELGRALGGYVNIVTRSGTNVVHGSLYNYLRDDTLNASNPLSGTTLPMSQYQYGGSLGGPLVKDRSFYFTNVERRRLDQSGLATIAPADAAAINARLLEAGYPGPRVATGIYPNPVRSTNVLAKVDHQASGRVQLGLRYGLYTVDAEHARGAGGLNAPSASSNLENVDQTLAASSAWTLSPRTLLEARAQVAHGNLQAPPSDPIGPAVSIAGVASFGTSSTSPTRRVNTLYQFVSSLSHQAGAHAFRAGVDVLANDNRIVFPRASRGSYAFASLAAFLSGAYDNAGFTQTFGATEVAQTNPNLGLYVQDEWKAGTAVTLNVGLRYDLQFLETINPDANNLSPRIGVAWSPFASRRTIVRANAGVFYDRVPLRPLANALLSAGNTTDPAALRQSSVTLSPAQQGAPAFPAVLDEAVPSLTRVNFTTMDRRLRNAHSRQASVEVEQQIGPRATLGVAYQYLRGVDLLMSINRNAPTCPPSGANNGCRPNPDYANNTQYSSAGESSYHGLHVSFAQRPAEWGQLRVSYTLSKAMSNVGPFFFSSPIDPADLSKDWGRSDDDRRHRLVIAGAVRTPPGGAATFWQRLTRGIELSGMLQAYSALPLNITTGATTIHGTPGRPIVGGEFIPRNAGEGSDFFSVSARVSRTFRIGERLRLEALAEGFNLTNRANAIARNGTFGTGAYPGEPLPTFGQVTAVGEPRAFQFGIRLEF